MSRTDSLEKTLMLGKIEGRRRGGDREWDGWMASLTQWTWVFSKLQEMVKDRKAWHAVVHGVTKSWTWLSDWTATTNSVCCRAGLGTTPCPASPALALFLVSCPMVKGHRLLKHCIVQWWMPGMSSLEHFSIIRLRLGLGPRHLMIAIPITNLWFCKPKLDWQFEKDHLSLSVFSFHTDLFQVVAHSLSK